jgi:hypothetical protein
VERIHAAQARHRVEPPVGARDDVDVVQPARREGNTVVRPEAGLAELECASFITSSVTGSSGENVPYAKPATPRRSSAVVVR